MTRISETVTVSTRFHMWIAWWPMTAHALNMARVARSGANPSAVSWVITCVGASAATIDGLSKDLSDTLDTGAPPKERGRTLAWRAAQHSGSLLGQSMRTELLNRIDEIGVARNESLHHTPTWVMTESGAKHPDADLFDVDLADRTVETLTEFLQVIAQGPATPFADDLVNAQVTGICDAAANAATHLQRALGRPPANM